MVERALQRLCVGHITPPLCGSYNGAAEKKKRRVASVAYASSFF